MHARFAVSAAVLALGVAACSDQQPPTSPSAAPVGEAPLFAISDAAHGGNPNFFFLPPLQPSPRKNPNFKRGGFNPNLVPKVKICDGRDTTAAGECVKPLTKNGQPAVFTAVRGWDGLPDWVDPEQYHVLWQTRPYNLVADGKHAYRILVKVGSTLLGFLDLVPTNGLLSALRVSAGGTDIGWLDDWVVPIRFRIQNGALSTECTDPASCSETAVIGAAAGAPADTTKAIVVPSGYAALSIPPSAVKQGDTVTIVIERQAPPDTINGTPQCLPTDIVQSKGCWHFRSEPAGYAFVHPVTMQVCVDPGVLNPDQLRLFKYNVSEGLKELPWVEPTLLTCGDFQAMANPVGSRPSNFASAALRRLGRWAGRLFGPRPLYAARFATPPKGIGGGGGSLSDFGGAIPGTATQDTLHLTVPASDTVADTTLFAVASGGSGTGTYSYASLTTDTCTVNAASGRITAKAPGTCKLTATKAADDVYSARTSDPRSFKINTGAVASVAVTPAGASISGVGSTLTFAAVAKDAHGNTISGKTFTWTSLNTNVATINSSTGAATAVGSGQVTISATADGVTGYALLTVAIPGATPVNLWAFMFSPTIKVVDSTATARLWGIWGGSGSSVFAGADGGGIYHFDGTTWTPSCSSCYGGLAVWGTSSTDVFAVDANVISHFDGTNWSTTQLSSGYLIGIWGTSPRDVYAVGSSGAILHFDGTTWTPMASGISAELRAIWGSSASDIWAVGRGGAIVHYDGTHWSSVTSPTTGDLYAMWGFSGSEVYAIGNLGAVKYNGSSWSALANYAYAGNGIWGSSGADIYSVGGNLSITRYDGTSVAIVNAGSPGAGKFLFGVWGTSTSDVYAVGDGPTIVRGVRGATVTVTPANPTLTSIGATQHLTATAWDAASRVVSVWFTWASSNTGVATVDSAGNITAVASGTATITATAPGGASGSATVTVAAAPAKLAFTLQPSSTPVLTAISPAVQVTVQDALGNTVTGSMASVTVVITSGTGTTGAVLGGTLTQTAVNGVATFANLTIDNAGSGYTLTATATGLISATSSTFAVSCPAANDGVLCEPQWATATKFTFDANLVGGGTTPATLYVWNDAKDLHLAVRLAFTGTESSLIFEFDNNNDGVAENGDDVVLLNPPNQFFDDFRTNIPPCSLVDGAPPAEATCGFFDTQDGGRNDGSGAVHRDGSFSVYEMSHPLNSGDTGHDFALTAGQSPSQQVGMFLMLQLANWPAYADTYYPGFRNYITITIK